MKVISLNTCGGVLRAPLMDFILREAPSTDVFCFQEMYQNDAEITAALHNFSVEFTAAVEGHGLAIFTKKSYVAAYGSVFVAGSYNTLLPSGSLMNWPVLVQYAEIIGPVGTFIVAHLHGMSYPGNKLDTPERLAQSDFVSAFISKQKFPVILLGDFNLLPDTKSIAKIEEIPMRNLIKEYGIKNTRPMNHLFKYPEQNRQFFADYAFVSPQIAVKKFSVPDIEISDHLPLILELA